MCEWCEPDDSLVMCDISAAKSCIPTKMPEHTRMHALWECVTTVSISQRWLLKLQRQWHFGWTSVGEVTVFSPVHILHCGRFKLNLWTMPPKRPNQYLLFNVFQQFWMYSNKNVSFVISLTLWDPQYTHFFRGALGGHIEVSHISVVHHLKAGDLKINVRCNSALCVKFF